MSKNKLVIIHADDFGRTAGINRAIAKGYSEGIITSTSILANTPNFEDAAKFAKIHPDLDIGIHLTIIGGRSISDPKKVKSLLNKDETFHNVWTQLLPALALGRVDPKELELEFEEQILRVKNYGLKPTHLDSHQHVHMYPLIMKVLVKLACKHKIPWIRLPQEGFNARLAMHSVSGKRVCESNAKRFLLAFLSGMLRKHIATSGVSYPDCFYGMMNSGNMTKEVFLRLIDFIEPGLTEIMCHPGYVCKDLLRDFPNTRDKWEEELSMLLDAEVREKLRSCKIELTNYRRLCGQANVKVREYSPLLQS